MTSNNLSFGTWFLHTLVTQEGWPQKKGLLRKEVVSWDVINTAYKMLEFNAKVIGLCEPEIATKLLAHGFGNRNWLTDPPDIDWKNSLDAMSKNPYTPPTNNPNDMLSWNNVLSQEFSIITEMKHIGALWLGLRNNPSLKTELDHEIHAQSKLAAQMHPEAQRIFSVNIRNIPKSLEESTDLIMREVIGGWETLTGPLQSAPEPLRKFIEEHRG
jgi:hypothetical protein